MFAKLKQVGLLAIGYWLFSFLPALARTKGGFGLEETAEAGKLITDANNPPSFGPATVAGTVVGYVLAFVGVVFFIFVLYGGFLWMTAAGNDEKVKKAIKIIESSVIGLAIIFLSYVITRLILDKIMGSIE